MPALSVFQTLPLHIAEAIAQYYIGTYRLTYSSQAARGRRLDKAWMTLYKVSNVWRDLALGYFCRGIELRLLSADKDEGFVFPYLPNQLKRKQVWSYSYVKYIDITVSYTSDQQYRERVKAFRDAWPTDIAFPVARYMKVKIQCPSRRPITRGPLIKDGILFWLAKRLPTSVPKLQSGIVYIYLDLQLVPMLRTEKCMSKNAITFFSTLFDKAKEVEISITYTKFDNCSNLLSRSFQGMTGLTFDCRANSDILYSIIKKTRHTLETLDVCLFDTKNMKLLFYDDDDQAVTYPRLRKLRLNSRTGTVIDEMSKTDESVAPFPALTSLTWSSEHLFSDDTLFRGNSGTLRHLNIDLDRDLVNVLGKYKVFAEGKYPNLHYLTIYISYGIVEGILDPEPFARHALSLLSPAVRVFSLENGKLPLLFAPYIACSSSFAENIQVLNLCNAEMDFDDMLEVIGLLPNLTDICCLSRGSLLDINKDLEEEIGYYQKAFYPLSHRLKSWSFAKRSYTSIKAIALKSAILAILCTNFTFTAVPFEKRHYYYYMLKRILKQPGLSKYAEKINPLFRYE